MIGRALRVALPCALLASLPALAETYTIHGTFQNKSSHAGTANYHDNDNGLAMMTREVQPGAQVEWPARRDASRPTNEESKYDISVTTPAGKCSATLHVTWQYQTPTGYRFMYCTIVDRIDSGSVRCDSASRVGDQAGKTCYAAIALY